MVLGQKLYQCCNFLIVLCDIDFKMLGKHVEEIRLNLMNIKYSKTFVKHYN